MDKTTIIVCAAVGSLGVLSAIFGFSAEGTKLTPYTILLVYGSGKCIYPQNPAFGLGICAVIFLLVAQVTISAAGGCCGCCKPRSSPSEAKRIVGIVCGVFSWIAALIAWVLLIEGAAWNANVVREATPYCPYLKDGIFAGAGVLTLAATALGLASYIMMRTPQPQTAAVLQVPPKGEPQLPAAPTAAADQSNNGSHAPDQQAPPSNVAPPPEAVASAPPFPQAPPSNAGLQVASVTHEEPSELPAPLQVSQSLQPAQVPNMYDMPQFTPVGLDVPAPLPPPTTTSAGSGQPGLSTVVRNEVAKQGIRLAAKVVEHSLFSDDN